MIGCGLVVREKYREVLSEDYGVEEVEVENDNRHTHAQASYEHVMMDYQMAMQIVSSLPVEVFMGLFSLLCTWSLLSLTCFHALLISLAQTTNERVRGVYQYGGVENVDDLGCWRNWTSVMCRSKTVESLLPDFSEVATLPEGRGKESVWVDWKADESFTSLITPESGGSNGGAH
jgi:hypothetical protein